jgi:hypothetical protein
MEINRDWETIRKTISVLAKESLDFYELKKHEPWFDKGCSTLLDKRKHPKFAVVIAAKRNKWG